MKLYKKRLTKCIKSLKLRYLLYQLDLNQSYLTKMNFIRLKLLFITAAMIVNAKPTEKPFSYRKLLRANLNESSLMLELKWLNHATNIVQLNDVGEVEEDCFYSGLFIEDPQR